ncbi:MAG TPA: DUF692 family protein [Kofleriaceae bacterium]|nr:DUF692 family protein [Kofleriaceae bacterium]
METFPQIGVGIQYNGGLQPWFPFDELAVDAFEIFLDSLAGPIDSPYVAYPGALDSIEPLRARGAILIAHSNFGGEFGFDRLEETVAVRRHIPLTHMLKSPWVSDHCFYCDDSRADMWSSPLQLSRAELARLAPRARELQRLYGVPLCHENAVYYLPVPGSDMQEAEFLSALVDAAGTYLHLDLHNVYANSRNLPDYHCDQFLAEIPLDRVVEIHIAGGSELGGFYHDWHDNAVPEPVWEMLEQVLSATRIGAVVLEFQGRSHDAETRVLSAERDIETIYADVDRAIRMWERAYGRDSRALVRASAGSPVAAAEGVRAAIDGNGALVREADALPR